MARTRVRIPALLALSAALALTTAACGTDESPAAQPETTSDGKEGGTSDGTSDGKADGKAEAGPKVVVTTTWEGAFAKAAGAEDIDVIVPQSVHHAPDYDPKPSDLAAVAKADFVLYAPFEPYAEKIKEAAGSDAELVEVGLDNNADKVKAEVARLAEKFGTGNSAEKWAGTFDTEYAALSEDLKSAWPGGKSPKIVSQVFTTWAAELAGATTVGTYGPEAVTPAQLGELSKRKPAFVLDNAHMSTGAVLPDSGVEQVQIVNYPGDTLDLLSVYRDAATAMKKAMNAA
ncbi:ABC transporter substrate-binding protein [Streptomyces sp. 549]|uniref:metal ABC transporter solute-binding protein, Zn/Mn family n=1 Tax=Streptomyces sp. 549 TaxID=3049076 RepID=UPI0024C42644|nr:zinc ABC transporter substrate-binding protein [Streptomyces sp. 549]MDK1473161.1 ABC transporter substrate-binding protein [Streptomyces sp. 549]